MALFWDDEEGEDGLALVSAKGRKGVPFASLKRLEYARKPRKIIANPFELPPGSDVIFDVESFWNYFLVGFKHIDTGSYFYAESRVLPGAIFPTPFPADEVRKALWYFRVIGFNSKTYDLPVLEAAIKGDGPYELKELTNAIIKFNERKFNPNSPYNHVDLIQVAPLKNSLKGYGACLHAERLQEMPIDEDAYLTPEQMDDVLEYNFNDLDVTELLFKEPTYGLEPHIGLRERLGAEIKEDIRSKSDAQVAEAFINARIAELTGSRPRTPEFEEGVSFNYVAPAWVQFQTPMFRQALEIAQSCEFVLDPSGKPKMPRELANLKLKLGLCEYKMGMGGLHSNEKSAAYRADEDTLLIDTDVASYYPWIMILNNYFPSHIGPLFIDIFRDDLVLRRLALKKLKDKLEAGLKIAINGTFGKQGNKYSTIFTPNGVIQTTVTGQLGLMMPIEMANQAGFEVLSANTDGFVTRVPKRRYDEFRGIVGMWERMTGFQTEETVYSALYSRDVNNYLAVKQMEPGKNRPEVKTKGAYSERGSAQNSVLSKNPETLICSDAVKELLAVGTPIEETIRSCRDIRRFVTVRNVRGGAHKDGWFLGKVVRWYYAKGVRGEINYVTTGNKVPNSEGAKPYMELGLFPDDVDFEYYERKAYGMLRDIGYFGGISRQKSLF